MGRPRNRGITVTRRAATRNWNARGKSSARSTGENAVSDDSSSSSRDRIESDSRAPPAVSRPSADADSASPTTRLLEVNHKTTAKIRHLIHEDIPLIDSWWEIGGTPTSMTTVA